MTSITTTKPSRSLHERAKVDIERDAILLRGFARSNHHGQRLEQKMLAAKIRARCIATAMALERGLKTTLRDIAWHAEVSERYLHLHFKSKEALFAFPPPEMAQALVETASTATCWSDIRNTIRPLFEALERNEQGKQLIRDLAALHTKYPDLYSSDGYFVQELKTQLHARRERVDPIVLRYAGYFTDGYRQALSDWACIEGQSTELIYHQICAMLQTSHSPFAYDPIVLRPF